MRLSKKIIFIIILFFAFMCNTDALYESNSGTSYNGTVGSCGTTKNCNNNGNYFIMQARLYYINNASFTNIGKTIYFVNTSAYNALNGKGLSLIRVPAFDGYASNANGFTSGYNYLNGTYFNNDANAKSFLNNITGASNYDEVLNKETQSKGGTKGYRILIEPAQNYANPSFSNENSAIYTVKGLATETMVINANGTIEHDASETNKNNPKDLLGVKKKSQWLFNDFNDVGIIRATNREYCEDIDIEQLSDIKYGCGYRLIDITRYISVKGCYSQNGIKTQNGGVKCTNYDSNNEDTYSANYIETGCAGKTESDRLSYLKTYGKLINGTNSCGIYCKEEAKVSFPGNVLNPIQQGSYFAWPSRQDDITGKYKMSITLNLTCQTVGTQNSYIGTTFERKCPTGYVAYTGQINGKTYDVCRKNNSLAKVCPAGYVPYKNGNLDICRKTTDTPKICPSGYSVSVNATQCRNNSVQGKVCPSGYPNKYNNKCYKACSSGYTFANGKCRKQINFVCRSTQYSSGGKCYDKTNKTCPSGWSASGNQCSKISGYYCDPGYMKSSANNCWRCDATMYTGSGGGGDRTSNIDIANSCGTWTSKSVRSCPGGWSYYVGGGVCRKSKYIGRPCSSGGYRCYNDGFCCQLPSYSTKWTWSYWSSSRSDGFIQGTSHASYSYTGKVCPSGYTSLNDTQCRSNSASNPNVCDGDIINGKCFSNAGIKTPESTNLVCPSGATSVSGTCYILKNKICNASTTVEISGKCYQKANLVCDSTSTKVKSYNKTLGTEKAPVKKDYANKVCPLTHTTERNGRCVDIINPINISSGNYISYSEYAATCPGGYSRTGSTGGSACSQFAYYSCPNGGSLSGSTCYKTTTKRNYSSVYVWCPNGRCNSYSNISTPSAEYRLMGSSYWAKSRCPSSTLLLIGGSKERCQKYEKSWYSTSTTSYSATAHYNYSSFNSCDSGYSLEGTTCVRREKCTSGTLYNHACYTCKAGYSFSMTNGKCEQTVDKVCPSPYTNGVENNRCVKNRIDDNYCDNVSVTSVNAVTRKLTFSDTGYTYVKKTDKCVKCNTGRVVSDGLCKYAITATLPKSVLIGSTCHELIPKINDWSCPANYTRNGTTCKNTCSRASLINGLKISLSEKPIAKLKGGTNNTIDEELLATTKVESDDTNLKFTAKTTFEINNSTNRYFNKQTGAVANSASGWNMKYVFDRKQGVVSLGLTDPVTRNGKSVSYSLELSNFKFGVIDNYGASITNYKCSYKTTVNSCKCPSGTDFAGVSVYDLTSNICNLEDNDGSCAELQYKLCNKPDRYYCKNSSNTKIDITGCVTSKMNSGKKPYVAFLECRNETSQCTDTCNLNCKGSCVESSKKVGNVELNVTRCGGKVCNIAPYCTNDDAIVSSSSLECIAEKLNLNSEKRLKDAINNGTVSNAQLEDAAHACESTICGKQRILFRVIDLKNPFYGNITRNISGLSLTGNKSRKPGSNWNSNSVVNANILRARNATGNALYNKTPLYTITLTPKDVKKIREYNKDHPYSDFNLNCNDNESTFGCISSFIHGDSESLKSIGADVKGTDDCTELNMQSNTTSYRECYNTNN